MTDRGEFPEREEYQLPDYLPPRFRSWCDFYAFLLDLQLKMNWDKLPKRVHIMEDGELTVDKSLENVVYKQTFKITKVKARAFEELWAVLPEKRTANATRHIILQAYCGSQAVEHYTEWIKNIFHLLPTVKL